MVYVSMRYTVADYDTWRGVFDSNDGTRRTAGCTGKVQVYRDVDDPKTVTLLLEWNTVENARKFLDDPGLRERMKEAGVMGAPAVRTILTQA